jgi:hypothetical protein
LTNVLVFCFSVPAWESLNNKLNQYTHRRRQQLCVTAESDRFGSPGTHMRTTSPRTKMCNTERTEEGSQPTWQTDESKAMVVILSIGGDTANALRNLLQREERFDKTSLRNASTGSARVAHPGTAAFTKQKVLHMVNEFGYISSFHESPNVHYSSHKSQPLNYIIRVPPSILTTYFSKMWDRIRPGFPVTVPVSRKTLFGTPNVPGVFFFQAMHLLHFWQLLRTFWLFHSARKHLQD